MSKLDRCWKDCLRMWKWISENKKRGMSVVSMKIEWLRVHRFKKPIRAYCFFCEYAGVVKLTSGMKIPNCDNCPGRLVGNRFDCQNVTYNYYNHPKALDHNVLAM